MTTQISSQIQVYHRLIRQHHGFMMEYAEVQTITHEYIEATDIFAQPENPLSLSFELTFVMSLILLLPIFIYLAYRYGKKMGKKENNLSSPQTSSPIIKKLTLSNRSTGDAFSESDEADFEPLVPFESRKNVAPGETNCNNKNAFKQENVSQTKNSLSPSKSTSSENSNNSGKSIEGTKEKGLNSNIKSGSQSQDDNILNKLNPPFKYATNDDLVTFSLTMQHAFDKETKNPNLHHSLDDEKILLHTDENQVKKREMKFQLNLEMKNGVFEKVETQEVRTVYCETAQEPEMNALLLKKAYEKYQDNSLNDKPFLNLNKNKENRGFRNALVPLKTPLIYQHVLTSENQLCLLDGSNKVSKNQNGCQESDTIPKSPEEAKIQDLQVLLEQDDLPHETGKFNKIFKNPEIIGEGSFGEVYKVIHKLDGKIYAVKKVKLAFGRIEDLQQKSKVFREVFAMTDLHHPNIVRYSTCWVEIEASKDSDISSRIKKEFGSECRSSNIVEELESFEESESEASPPAKNYSNTSSMAFEWDVGNGDSEKSKSPKITDKKLKSNNKKRPNKKKTGSALIFKSLSKTFIKEEGSSASNISKGEQPQTINGYKLYLYIQMEYCAGENLRNYLDTSKNDVSQQKTLKMFRKLLEGVKAIHQRGILHRDLKPANIFLDGEENVKIGDFGLASLGSPEELKGVTLQMRRSTSKTSDRSLSMKIGTPMYSSPEQESGKRYNNKTDIYSLGLILSEMLANLSTHHERYQLFNMLRKNHELPTELKTKFAKESELILKMTALSPEERPSAEELIMEIDQLLEESSK